MASTAFRNLALVLIAGLVLFTPDKVQSFPPAPHHTIYGLVRDELGNPLASTHARIILQTSAGIEIKSAITPNLQPGVNYRLNVPMDSGLTVDAYKPTALRPTVPFRIKVQIGKISYVPIEMTANFSSLGEPGGKTRIDLTLGEDADGDGIPDAWERMLLAANPGLSLADLRRGDDFDGDGVSNFAEYVAGTYAFDPADGFRLAIVGFSNNAPLLDFLAIRGRSYQVHGSPDLKAWRPLEFLVPAEGPAPEIRKSYAATDVRNLRVQVILPVGSDVRFFKVQVQ